MPEANKFDYGLRPTQNMRLALIAASFAALSFLAFIVADDASALSRAIFVIFGAVMAGIALLLMNAIQPAEQRENALHLAEDRLDVSIKGRKPIVASVPYRNMSGITRLPMRYGQIMFNLNHTDGALTLSNSLFNSKAEAKRFLTLLEQRIPPAAAGTT